ncbi:ArsR/SmtB family transcription factor [Kitasatospora sp. NPDC098652]|uniref:ArsR/SmtB family transcription factor n=1 Tax=Kitasatospora sp. NPDC098652 TaxID=3364095 RepID=UPI00380110E7
MLGGVAGPQHHCARDSVNRDRWWRRVKGHVPQQAAVFVELVNASPLGVPMFLTPDRTGARATIGDELDALLALPEAEVHQEMQGYGTGPHLPRVIAELRDDGTRQLRRITDAAWALFRSCLAPDWPDIQRALRADIEQRSRTVAETGLGPMLAQLHPDLSWHDEGLLRYAGPEWQLAYDLGGRGLELRPNLFLSGLTAPLGDHRSSALLYPGREHPARRADGLARLIGAARTRALRAIAQGACTTGQLAESLGVSAPTASAHATVLRDAGAITTERRGREVRHSVTALGRDLLG